MNVHRRHPSEHEPETDTDDAPVKVKAANARMDAILDRLERAVEQAIIEARREAQSE